jgi:hypothetical protein
MAPEQAAALAGKMATGTWTHDCGITAEEDAFMNLFPQPTRIQPSVQYVPMPYPRGPQGNAR